MTAFRQLGNSGVQVSAVGLGCWPIAGISSLGITESDSIRTIQAAVDFGINFFDTAYSYGYEGESDKLLRKALGPRICEVILASKVGTHYDANKQRIVDGRPETLIKHTREILQRLGLSHIDLLYLHTPDPKVAVEESADAFAQLIQRGLVRWAGVSNVDLVQLQKFHMRCPVVVVQNYFNMLQPESIDPIRQFCAERQIAIAAYWVLMKGLLAGKMHRDHHFDPQDRRLNYAVYQGTAWQRAHDLLDVLRDIALTCDCTVSQLVIAWTLSQPGITSALCGAKRPEQIMESAAAMRVNLAADQLAVIDTAIANCREALR